MSRRIAYLPQRSGTMRAVTDHEGKRETPRKLRLTFEFVIPPGTPANVRTKRRMEAVEAMRTAVAAVAGHALPPGTTMAVRDEWMYAWHDKTTGPLPLRPPAGPGAP